MDKGIKLSKTSPSFLHANSTSHTWAFSAIAELVDNAYDPDVMAKRLWIDVKNVFGQETLQFTDNGNGMSSDKLYHMLSFGYCEKAQYENQKHKPVGHYGNGFKSGSMRLGKDAIVFTKSALTLSVGLLSQTYLEQIHADTILIPMVTWDKQTKTLLDEPEVKSSLEEICKHSLFTSEAELLDAFQSLDQFNTGTKIIIYNLKKLSNDKTELDFTTIGNDIINNETQEMDAEEGRDRPIREYVSQWRLSLRTYLAILFLKPRMAIMLRGEKVKTILIAKSLSQRETDVYNPKCVNLPKPIKITFGFGSNLDYGMMLYHKNRLIKAYERVGCQKQAGEKGVGVVGVVEVDFLEPIHNKQDFNKTVQFNTVMERLGSKLNDYYDEKTNGEATEQTDAPDTWVQCDRCNTWRRLPQGYAPDDFPGEFICYLNPDLSYNKCEMKQEALDSDEGDITPRPTYEKTQKRKKAKERQAAKNTPQKEQQSVSSSTELAPTQTDDVSRSEDSEDAHQVSRKRRRLTAENDGEEASTSGTGATADNQSQATGNKNEADTTRPKLARLDGTTDISESAQVERDALAEENTMLRLEQATLKDKLVTLEQTVATLTGKRAQDDKNRQKNANQEESASNKTETESVKRELTELRFNVFTLLKQIEPDLEIGEIEDVDLYVMKLIKATIDVDQVACAATENSNNQS